MIREQRQSLGLSRKQLAELAGISESAVWSVENGKLTRDKNAIEKVNAALRIASAPQDVNDLPKAYRPGAAQRVTPDDWTVLTEWKGLVPGCKFTVVEIEGTFTFVRHVTNSVGDEWVDGYGGRSGYGSYRSFRAHLVHVF
jgi:DNA-binding XRE family transcriptional regulator